MKKHYKLVEIPTKVMDFSIAGVKMNPKYDYRIKCKTITLTSRGMEKIKTHLQSLKKNGKISKQLKDKL